jgi:hypothetical protein
MEFSRCARARVPSKRIAGARLKSGTGEPESRLDAGLSKLNSVSEPEVDVVLGDPNDPDERPAEPADIDGFGSPRSEVLRIP